MVLKYIFPTESITCFKNLTLTPLTTFSTVSVWGVSRSAIALAIHLAVHGVEARLSELRSIHVSGSENRFTQICAGSRIVIVVSDHVGSTWR